MPQSRSVRADGIVAELKAEILSGEREPGSRLPTEAQLCEHFAVSRATVRSAIKELDVLGLVWSQQGSGTFVRLRPTVRDGLERMGSITESIVASGKTPRQEYGRRTVRALTPHEAERMQVPASTEVLELRRRFFADAEVVCYTFDLIPLNIFPDGFEPEELSGSIFTYFRERLGRRPELGLAEVHAVESSHIAWGDGSGRHRLFLLLDQLQYDQSGTLVGYSRTYFVEGAYAFHLTRRN